jgi:hypothetical protein
LAPADVLLPLLLLLLLLLAPSTVANAAVLLLTLLLLHLASWMAAGGESAGRQARARGSSALALAARCGRVLQGNSSNARLVMLYSMRCSCRSRATQVAAA